MCQIYRALLIFVLPLLVVLVTPSAFAQSIGTLSASPTGIAFGSIAVGSSSAIKTTTLTNTGKATVTFKSDAISANFSWGGIGTCNDPGGTLAPGASCTFSAKFTPTAVGTVKGSMTIESNASNPTLTVPLSGTGAAASTYTVNLSWDASTSPNISGYNIYRAVYENSSCGSFSKVNLYLNASTAYTDSAVLDGTSYCYATTAVNSSNQESGYSNIASNVKVPAP